MQMLELVQFRYCPRCGKPTLKAKEIKACQCAECGFLYYHSPVPAAVAIIEDGDQIMLTTRVNDPHRGMLALPGGFIDYEESLEDGLLREMREELNLTARSYTYLCTHWDQYAFHDNLYNTLVAYFVVQVEDLAQASPADDVSSFQMVKPEDIDLSTLAFEADRVALKHYARFCDERKLRARKAAYSKKAEKYARYRWDYAPEAVQTIYECTGLGEQSVVADIGAGTGILTRHFAGKVGHVYAIEPNAEMRSEATKLLSRIENCTVLDASAEATGLPDQSVDVITVAQAIHWFDPDATRDEFQRILKPGGWLVLISNGGTDPEMGQAIEQISTAENGVSPRIHPPRRVPEWHYFGAGHYQKFSFPFEEHNDWEIFLGALLSTSFYPNEDDPAYEKFELAARAVFDRFNVDGLVSVPGITEVLIGRPLFSSVPISSI